MNVKTGFFHTGLIVASILFFFNSSAKASCVDPLTALSQLPHSMMDAGHRDSDGEFAVHAGALPDDLVGSVLITGTTPAKDQNGHNLHIFNGEPELRTLSFKGPTPARFSRKALTTPGTLIRKAVTAFGRPWSRYIDRGVLSLSPIYGPEITPSTAPFQIHDGKIIVAVDSGRPWYLDVKSGRLVAPIGKANDLRRVLDLPFGLGIPHTFIEANLMSAHPSFDSITQELFSANFSMAVPGSERLATKPQTSLVVSQDGKTWKSLGILNPDGSPALIHQSIHQVNVSEHFVVFGDTSFKVDLPSLIDSHLFSTQAPHVRLWIVPRSDIQEAFKKEKTAVTAHRIDLPYEFGHYFVKYDDQNGSVLELVMTTNRGTDLAHTILPDDRLVRDGSRVHPSFVGIPSGALDRGEVRKIRLKISGKPALNSVTLDGDQGVSSEATWGLTVSTGPWDATGIVKAFEKSLYAVSLGQTSDTIVKRIADQYMDRTRRTWADIAKERPASLIRVKLDPLKIADTFLFEHGKIPVSPQFAPRMLSSGELSEKADDGYIVVSVLSDSGDEIWIFDAKKLSQGPVTKLKNPKWNSGFTIHTLFLPPHEETSSDAAFHRELLESYRDEILKAREVLPFFERKWFQHNVWPQIENFFRERGLSL